MLTQQCFLLGDSGAKLFRKYK